MRFEKPAFGKMMVANINIYMKRVLIIFPLEEHKQNIFVNDSQYVSMATHSVNTPYKMEMWRLL